jgi:hypothetical protein
MIIGSRNVGALLHHIVNLSAYAESLVPPLFRKYEAIVNNQKYYIALKLRAESKLRYETRVDYTDKLLANVYLTGCITEFIEIEEIFDYVDFNKLMYNLLIKKEG